MLILPLVHFIMWIWAVLLAFQRYVLLPSSGSKWIERWKQHTHIPLKCWYHCPLSHDAKTQEHLQLLWCTLLLDVMMSADMLQELPHAPAPAAANTQPTKLNSSGSMPSLNQLSPWLVASDTSATTDTATKPVKHEQPVIHRKTVITTELWLCARHFKEEKSVK